MNSIIKLYKNYIKKLLCKSAGYDIINEDKNEEGFEKCGIQK
jgi:hypothetical protein